MTTFFLLLLMPAPRRFFVLAALAFLAAAVAARPELRPPPRPMMGRWPWWTAPAEGGDWPARWPEFGRAAFVALAGSREAPFLVVAVDDLPLQGFGGAAVAALDAGPDCDIGDMEIGNSGPGIRLRSVVAVMAWMAAPKGSVKAFVTRRRAPEKVYTVLWGHESAPNLK